MYFAIITNRSPIRNEKGVMGAVAVFQDMTELQEVAAELENVKNMIIHKIENNNDCINTRKS